MSSLVEDTDGILFTFVRVEEHRGGKWSAALEPHTVWPIDKGEGSLPPGQCVEVGSYDYIIYNELDMLGWPARMQASSAGGYGELWAGRPYFHTFHSAKHMIMTWIKKNRNDLVQIATGEARSGRVWRAAHPTPPQAPPPPAAWFDMLPR